MEATLILHNPWRHLAVHHPGVRVIWTRIPGATRGFTDGERIWLDDRLTQVQRRVTVCHETIHIERGIIPADSLEEARVNRLVAQRLISTDQLVDALRWHRHPSLPSLADNLWVDVATVKCRLDTMPEQEQSAIQQQLGNAA